jgi:hypothetical protein
MQKIWIYGLLLAFWVSACHKNTDEVIIEETLDEYIELPNLLINVRDNSGAPMDNAELELEGKRYQTNSEGKVQLQRVKINPEGSGIKGHIEGYFTGVNRVVANQSEVTITVTPLSTARTFTSSSGWSGQIEGEPIRLSVPANAFVTQNGQAYNGEVRLYYKRIMRHHAEFQSVVPPLMAQTAEQDWRVQMAPFGVFLIEATDQVGNTLRLRSGQVINLELTTTSNTGVWQKQAVLKLNKQHNWVASGDFTASENGYNASINDLSVPWTLLPFFSDRFFNMEIGEVAYLLGDTTGFSGPFYFHAASGSPYVEGTLLLLTFGYPVQQPLNEPYDMRTGFSWIEPEYNGFNNNIVCSLSTTNCPDEMFVTLLPTDNPIRLFGAINGLLPDGRIVQGNFFSKKPQ